MENGERKRGETENGEGNIMKNGDKYIWNGMETYQELVSNAAAQAQLQ